MDERPFRRGRRRGSRLKALIERGEVPATWLGSNDVVQLLRPLGVTYRQLDYWHHHGVAKATQQIGGEGSGSDRAYDPNAVARVRNVAILANYGWQPSALADVADETLSALVRAISAAFQTESTGPEETSHEPA